MAGDSVRRKLARASTYASERFTTTGHEKDTHGPRPITLPTLESKRRLDREIFGEEGSGRDADRGADQAVDEQRGRADDLRGAGAAAAGGDGGPGVFATAAGDQGNAGLTARAERLFGKG